MKTLTIGINTYEVVDAASRYAISALETILGDVNDLRTADKSSLINSINEIADQVSNLSYGGGDAEAGAIIKTLEEAIGDLSNLQTDDTSSLVAAINELKAELADIPSGGALDSELIEAIESLEQTTENITNDIGDIGELKTTDKSSVVAAINELSTKTPTASNGEDAEARAAIEELTETIDDIGHSVDELNTSVGTLSSLQTTNKTSLVDAINELSTQSPTQSNGEDIEAREAIEELNDAFDGLGQNVDTLVSAVGTLSSLQTTNKTNLVSAINELANRTPTSEPTTNTVDNEAREALAQLTVAIGNLSNLKTEDKTTIVSAINELLTKINSFTGSDISKDELDEAFGEVWEALLAVEKVIGIPDNLETNATNLVEAINEVLNKIPAEVGDGVDTEARASIEALNETVSALNDNVSNISDSVSNMNDVLGDIDELQTTNKASIVAALNELANRPSGDGSGGLTEVTWEDVKNKPFGDVTPIIWEVDPNAEPDPNADGMIRIGDVPESIELLCGGAIIGADGVSVQIYTEIIADFNAIEDIPAEYGAAIIDGNFLDMPNGMYVIYTNPIADLLAFVCTEDVNDEALGVALPAGMYVSPELEISRVVGIKVTKIPSIYLPPMDDGAGAFVLDLTSMTDQDGNPIILTSGTSISVSDADSSMVSSAVSAAIAGKPLIIKAHTSATGNKIVQMTGSVTIEDASLFVVYISGIFGDLDNLSDIYKFNIRLVGVSSNATIVPYITPILDGLPSPASNIKYLDFGDAAVGLEAINFSEFHAGDLILCLTNLT